MRFMGSGVVVLGLVLAAACTKPNPAANCGGNGVCTEPSHQYCDVDGSISGDPNTCVAVSCTAGEIKSCAGSSSALVCNAGGNGYDTQSCAYGCDPNTGCESGSNGGSGNCTPNAVLRCEGPQLVSCNAGGTGEVTQTCALGCDGVGPRCKGVDPSNGLATYLDQAAQQGDVTLPDGTAISTDNGTVNGPAGVIAVATTIISQPGGPMLRVLIANSFSIGNVRVDGTAALAIVSANDISIHGVLDLSADGVSAGPGAINCVGNGAGGGPAPGAFDARPASNSGGYPNYLWAIGGGGGGGFGSTGGTGGSGNGLTPGGAGVVNGVATLAPLRGGCPGGDQSGGPYAGAGGGAVQLVSNHTVHLVDAGATKGDVHVGGGGGHAGDLGKASLSDTTAVYSPGGGGAGGGILIEASALVLDANTGLSAAGGGGGGWGACAPVANGSDAPPSASTPSGGSCGAGTTPAQLGGDGATIADGSSGQASTYGSGGGGGGGLGRIRISTADGQYSTQTSSTVRGVVTTGIVQGR
jgi:hypothetical protein